MGKFRNIPSLVSSQSVFLLGTILLLQLLQCIWLHSVNLYLVRYVHMYVLFKQHVYFKDSSSYQLCESW